MTQQVRVGVGCFLVNSRGEFVVGVRKGSHGAGCLQLPGGHLDFGETPEACAVREVAEETGLAIREEDARFLTATNDIFEAEGKHYITMFVVCRVADDAKPQVLEPEKCERWEWHTWPQLKELASAPHNRLFLPLRNLFLQRPDADPRRLVL
ncbi:Nudix hydrolase 1 [Rhodotorula toruloides]|nr:Nudix hydrolase 1 [Rhodotorula toruloides]